MDRHIGLEIRKLSNLLKRELYREADENGFDFGVHGQIIYFLIRHSDQEIFQKDIEEVFSMRRSTVSRMLKLMENKGLIERKSVESDARLKKIVPTEEAKKVQDIIIKRRVEMEEKMRQGISEEELILFFDVIEKIKGNLE